MVFEEDYFIIYDAWSGVRKKWVRAVEKDKAIEILDKINDKTSGVELRKKLFAFFFAPEKINIDFNDRSNFSSDWYIVYIPLESDLFRDAFERSKRTMLFHGGKSSKRSKSRKKRNGKIKTRRYR